MVKCMECGRKVKAFRGYRHPTMGQKYIVCHDCYDNINQSVNKWKQVIMPYTNYFTNSTPKKSTSYKFVDITKRVAYGFKIFH